MPQHVGGNAFGEAAMLPGFAAGGLHGAGGEMQMRTPGGKQPRAGGMQDAVISAEDLQETGREHGVTILAALTVLDTDEHPLAVDVGRLEGDGFGNAQAGAVAAQQHGAVLDAGDMVEEALDFIGGQHHG